VPCPAGLLGGWQTCSPFGVGRDRSGIFAFSLSLSPLSSSLALRFFQAAACSSLLSFSLAAAVERSRSAVLVGSHLATFLCTVPYEHEVHVLSTPASFIFSILRPTTAL